MPETTKDLAYDNPIKVSAGAGEVQVLAQPMPMDKGKCRPPIRVNAPHSSIPEQASRIRLVAGGSASMRKGEAFLDIVDHPP